MAKERTGQTTDFSSQALTAGSAIDSYSITSRDTDGAGIRGSEWTPDWSRWHGIYRAIPELREVINKLASWTFGRGIKADEKNKAKLSKIRGFGKDSPRGVLKNQWRTALICGDSFAHIIEDSQRRMTN